MEYKAVVCRIVAYWSTDEGQKMPDLQVLYENLDDVADGEEPAVTWNGKPELATAYTAAANKIEFLKLKLAAAKGDIDTLIYRELWHARLMASVEHMCEMSYKYGPSGSGKDVDINFVQSFFGPELCGTIAPTDVVKLPGQQEKGVDGSTPTMHALNGCRVALVAEVPQGTFAWHRLKHFVEQQGAAAHSRGHSANPKAVSPTYGIMCWSNYAPDFTGLPVEGAPRRTAVELMDCRYGKNASAEDHEYVSDNRLKYRIRDGEFRLQQLWCGMAWLDAFDRFETSIPKPAAVRASSSLVLPSPMKEWAAQFLEECRPCDSMTTADIKKSAADVLRLGVRSPDLVVALRSAGFSLDVRVGGGSKRAVKYKFVQDAEAKFCRLKALL